MPTNRRRTPRSRQVIETPAWMIEYLKIGTFPEREFADPERVDFWQFKGNTEAQKNLWDKMKNEILKAWVRQRPGTRPYGFWQFETSEACYKMPNAKTQLKYLKKYKLLSKSELKGLETERFAA